MSGSPNQCPVDSPVAVDLFSGSGSVTAALKSVGFRVAAAIDVDPIAALTYKANHPEVEFYEEDIRKVSATSVRDELDVEGIDMLAVCAPCQPFSSQNRKRSSQDRRSRLLLEALRFVHALRPVTIWIENVPGLANSTVSSRLVDGLMRLGYSVGNPLKVDAADLGVPQRRIRFVLVASRKQSVVDQFIANSVVPRERSSVRRALLGLSRLSSGDRDMQDTLHVARRHAEITLRRLAAIPKDGGSRLSLPEDLQLKCHAKLGPNSFPDVYGRMSWDDVAPTLTTGCSDVTRGRFAHPVEDRAITLREAARLQTFPDDYSFCGNHSQIAAQIGNAVPMKMAVEMFKALSPTLRSE